MGLGGPEGWRGEAESLGLLGRERALEIGRGGGRLCGAVGGRGL